MILSSGQSTDNVDPQSALEYEIYRNGLFFELVTGTGVTGIYAGGGDQHVDGEGRGRRSGSSRWQSNPATVTVFRTKPLLAAGSVGRGA